MSINFSNREVGGQQAEALATALLISHNGTPNDASDDWGYYAEATVASSYDHWDTFRWTLAKRFDLDAAAGWNAWGNRPADGWTTLLSDVDGIEFSHGAPPAPGDLVPQVIGSAFVEVNFFVIEPCLPGSHTPKIINLSTRGHVGTGEQVMIAGIVVEGFGPMPVLFTARGPSINPSVGVRLENPVLTLVGQDGQVVAQSDDWGAGPDQQRIVNMGWDDNLHARDAAIYQELMPGAYTAIVEAADGNAGIGIVELYNVEHWSWAPFGEIVNLSTRGYVGQSGEVLVGGMIIGGVGREPLQCVFRGRGPSISSTVQNRLADPVMTLYGTGTAPLYTQDSWVQDPADLGQFQPGSPFEAAVAQDLIPGAHTVVVEGAGAASGVSIFEFFRR